MRLPSIYHKHDKNWILEQLRIISERASYQAAHIKSVQYSKAYKDKLQDQSIEEHRRECEARREANSRLRRAAEFVCQEKYKKV